LSLAIYITPATCHPHHRSAIYITPATCYQQLKTARSAASHSSAAINIISLHFLWKQRYKSKVKTNFHSAVQSKDTEGTLSKSHRCLKAGSLHQNTARIQVNLTYSLFTIIVLTGNVFTY